ncbi:hypothetical protein E1B28_008865 [Marasmius oreades]|uniref:RlpA-like protein double-psi beta-barrel domain-containing protein n=1 Tax=Marasmius oreades TaxID=181124 RepID=A0A9P7RZ66_9AGAR|nr:uncharacterized protein E1B28_008865 [Marasmius oreades]KAG7092514.1 hypothetical protein E1B28_008865 [Marasmius oreades]
MGSPEPVVLDSDLIAAIDVERYGDPNTQSVLCGKQVSITDIANGKSVVVTIADACVLCENENSFDLSLAAFQALDNLSAGILSIEWSFL